MATHLRIVSWLLVLIVSISTLKGSDGLTCWNFQTGNDGWTNGGIDTNEFDWKWSTVNGPADTNSIPSFYSTSEYMYFQDQDTAPVKGTVYSPSGISLNNGDQITITVFRHIIDTHLNDSSRPLLRFEESGVSHNIEFDYNYDRWDTVVATCGVTSICCTFYPCVGRFALDGVVYVRDELIAVDSVCYPGI